MHSIQSAITVHHAAYIRHEARDKKKFKTICPKNPKSPKSPKWGILKGISKLYGKEKIIYHKSVCTVFSLSHSLYLIKFH